MLSRLLRGAAAGAAGTTALNAVTYLDMWCVPGPRARRRRRPSNAPRS
ncbi:MAG TPA: hypothetical protein VLK57_01280 [Pseudonocardia sp.]|nr:hypothetical protein [Pseudonocardia sp.]